MIYTIIIFHNQLDNIYPILSKLEKQTIKTDVLIVSCDKIHQNKILSYDFDLNMIFSYHQSTNHFSAGLNRDLALCEIKHMYDNDIILFLDGDCIPKKNVIENHLIASKKFRKFHISCGLRHKIQKNKIEYDRRMKYSLNEHRLLLTSFDSMVNTITWTCNLCTNGYTIKKIRQINNKLNGDINRLFNSSFDGRWGLEDNFLGASAYMTGADIILCPRHSYVTHIHHEQARNDKLYKQKRIFSNLIEKLSNKIQSQEISKVVSDYAECKLFESKITSIDMIKDFFIIRLLTTRSDDINKFMKQYDDNPKIKKYIDHIHNQILLTRKNKNLVIK